MGGYKEYKIFDMLKRKSIIIRYIVFIILIFVVTAMFNVQLTKERKIQKDIVYTENSNLDYIQSYAKQQLGMQKPEKSQIVYINANYDSEVKSLEEQNIFSKLADMIKNIYN